VGADVLALIPASVERIDVGKRPGASTSQELINELLISLGQRFERVVRLKGGDPFVFGRGGEELEALHAAGIDTRVIPGISSAFGGPLAAGIPVTHRERSRGVCVVTGHTVGGPGIDFACLAHSEITLVVLMGVAGRARIANELMAGGLDASTPVACVESASTPEQRVVRCQLDTLGETEIANPAVLVIGAVADLDLNATLANIDSSCYH
jgi:uroporphyrin-III C-methyltransferase